MTTAVAIMHEGVAYLEPGDSALRAAERMRDLNLGALPICDDGGHPVGMITDRDITVLVVANGLDPATTTVGELSRLPVQTVDVAVGVAEALAIMARYRVRRLPVTEHDKVVGMISEADIARILPHAAVADFVEAIYE